jgi:hypothetical protein
MPFTSADLKVAEAELHNVVRFPGFDGVLSGLVMSRFSGHFASQPTFHREHRADPSKTNPEYRS